MILTKARVGRFTGPLREIVFRYEFGLQIIFIDLRWKQRFLQPFLVEFPINNYIHHFFCQIDIAERWGWQIYRATTGKWCQIRKWFATHINSIKVEIEIIAANFQRFFKQQVIFNCFCKVHIGKSVGWRIYRVTAGNWHQIWIWFAK